MELLDIEFKEKEKEIKKLKEKIKELNKYNRFEIMDI